MMNGHRAGLNWSLKPAFGPVNYTNTGSVLSCKSAKRVWAIVQQAGKGKFLHFNGNLHNSHFLKEIVLKIHKVKHSYPSEFAHLSILQCISLNAKCTKIGESVY